MDTNSKFQMGSRLSREMPNFWPLISRHQSTCHHPRVYRSLINENASPAPLHLSSQYQQSFLSLSHTHYLSSFAYGTPVVIAPGNFRYPPEKHRRRIRHLP
ncbi:hypothetical protein H5410_011262 [Solanum commersonii]|uniref:Uncharacterized protein n=1 Tax=Solanum commersonii TaxID=4109 RepID=A0A9J6ANV4_SOLCO|nr:hypothetical protein H5410_011262 [Solanum commersonii]